MEPREYTVKLKDGKLKMRPVRKKSKGNVAEMAAKRPCFRACGKAAKLPKEDPFFCSKDCAAKAAIAEFPAWFMWCDKHGWQAHSGEGCSECDF